MYPSLFPLRLKRTYPELHYPNENIENEGNGFMWLRGDTRERGVHPMNFQSFGRGPWIQQRFEPHMLRSEHDQHQVMSAAALQDMRGGDFLKQQLLQCQQQPFQFPLQFGITTPSLHQQFVQHTDPHQIISSQSQSVSDNRNVLNEQRKQQDNDMQNFSHMFQFQNNNLQQQKSPLPSQLCQNSVFPDVLPGTNLSSVLTPSIDGSANILYFTRLGQPMSEQNEQPWEPKLTLSQVSPFGSTVLLPSFSQKDDIETANCTADSQNHNVYGVNVDSSSLLSNGVPHLSANAFDSNVSPVPYSASCILNSLYGYLDESSGLGQNGEEADPTTGTFVKVYKSGSVGRLLNISRFSSYEEIREELGQMFGVEGQLEDPLRSGWQHVFIDRENDVLLGEDPWEALVNNVWYIKILSPEDVQKMGRMCRKWGSLELNPSPCPLEDEDFQTGSCYAFLRATSITKKHYLVLL